MPRASDPTCGQAKAGLEPLDEVSNIVTVMKHLLCAPVTTLGVLCNLIVTPILRGKDFYPRLTDEQTSLERFKGLPKVNSGVCCHTGGPRTLKRPSTLEQEQEHGPKVKPRAWLPCAADSFTLLSQPMTFAHSHVPTTTEARYVGSNETSGQRTPPQNATPVKFTPAFSLPQCLRQETAKQVWLRAHSVPLFFLKELLAFKRTAFQSTQCSLHPSGCVHLCFSNDYPSAQASDNRV